MGARRGQPFPKSTNPRAGVVTGGRGRFTQKELRTRFQTTRRGGGGNRVPVARPRTAPTPRPRPPPSPVQPISEITSGRDSQKREGLPQGRLKKSEVFCKFITDKETGKRKRVCRGRKKPVSTKPKKVQKRKPRRETVFSLGVGF